MIDFLMAYQFTTSRMVQFSDTDLAGIVHFANFYRFMEEAEHEFFRSLDIKILNKQPDGSIISWPRVSATCSFQSPAHYEDLLEITVRVERIGVKSLTIEYIFRCGGKDIAKGRMKTVCCLFRHGEPLKSVEIPQSYLDKLQEAPLPE